MTVATRPSEIRDPAAGDAGHCNPAVAIEDQGKGEVTDHQVTLGALELALGEPRRGPLGDRPERDEALELAASTRAIKGGPNACVKALGGMRAQVR